MLWGVAPHSPTLAGVRLLSHRPSVLFKVERLADPTGADPAEEGLALTGPDWEGRLKGLLDVLSIPERASLFAIRLDDRHALPLAADTLLARARTDWFPEFLSQGRMFPHFQPIVTLDEGLAIGREALMRGKLGAVEVRGGELLAAAEAHDALYSFDMRARAAALDVGLPLLPEGEVLFVNLDPRAALDVAGSLRTTWPLVERLGGDPGRICLELVEPERAPDRRLVGELVEAHRERGCLIALDDLSGGAESLAMVEALRPDFAKVDRSLTSRLVRSPGLRRLAAALVEYAHEQGCRVVAEGVETVDEMRVVRDLGCELGQGFYFGQPMPRPMPVDRRLVARA
jgi:EAL domain-containing protein (putative c-di-GMP-specific phosphodiesterase class I)